MVRRQIRPTQKFSRAPAQAAANPTPSPPNTKAAPPPPFPPGENTAARTVRPNPAAFSPRRAPFQSSSHQRRSPPKSPQRAALLASTLPHALFPSVKSPAEATHHCPFPNPLSNPPNPLRQHPKSKRLLAQISVGCCFNLSQATPAPSKRALSPAGSPTTLTSGQLESACPLQIAEIHRVSGPFFEPVRIWHLCRLPFNEFCTRKFKGQVA